ncbi:hypothetical protein NDU88_002714 [Pleurodeles waltl]|uniref:Uncharacterized protein n=1 Tax=Pleurodeles waltl TaxID=8319 RepID=A0AAV7SBD1_PLEWA|nr:hypothetical protein NDU88_002714 [Pleurodeles waltl]
MIKDEYVNALHEVSELTVQKEELLPDFVNEYKEVFSEKLGCLKKYTHSIRIKECSIPVAAKVRPVPISLKDDVEGEIKRLCEEGIIELVESSEWISPIVVARKLSGEIRLCIDLRNLNRCVVSDHSFIARAQEPHRKEHALGACVLHHTTARGNACASCESSY